MTLVSIKFSEMTLAYNFKFGDLNAWCHRQTFINLKFVKFLITEFTLIAKVSCYTVIKLSIRSICTIQSNYVYSTARLLFL